MSGTLVCIDTDGTRREIHWPKRTPPDYQTIQSAIGGMFERVRVHYAGWTRDMYCRENGIAESCVLNPDASELYGDSIVGPAAIWVPDKRVPK